MGYVEGLPPGTDEAGRGSLLYLTTQHGQDLKSKPLQCEGEIVDGGVLNKVDASVVFSPEMMATEAPIFGLAPGSSMDITNHDVDGRPWFFLRRR